MAKVKIVLNKSEIQKQLLKGAGTVAWLEAATRRSAADANSSAGVAGADYEASVEVGKNRARGAVVAANFEAMLDESQNLTLTRSIDAARR